MYRLDACSDCDGWPTASSADGVLVRGFALHRHTTIDPLTIAPGRDYEIRYIQKGKAIPVTGRGGL
jgi:hypothetical protein